MGSVDSQLLLTIIGQAQQKFIQDDFSDQCLYDFLLHSACQLSQSTSGFIANVVISDHKTPTMQICALGDFSTSTGNILDSAFTTALKSSNKFADSKAFLHSLATKMLITRKPLYYDCVSLCEQTYGLLYDCYFAAFPVIFRGDVIAVIGLTNQTEPFCQELIQALSPFIATCATLLSKLPIEVPTKVPADAVLMYKQAQSEDEEITANAYESAKRQIVGKQPDRINKKETEKEEKRFELDLWGGNLGLWDWNIGNGEVIYSSRWAEMLGYTLDEVAPTIDSWKNLIHPDDLPVVYENINKHLAGKTQSFQFEQRLRHKNGHWIWVLDSGKVLEWDNDGSPLRVIGTHLDITEKKIAEQEVNKLALVAQKTENGVIITDAYGSIEWVNDGFTRITGYAITEVKGKKPGEVLQGPETDKATIAFMSKKIRQKREFNVEVLNYSKSGEKHWLRIDVQPIISKHGVLQRFVAIQTDITKRKLAEQQLHFQANILRNVQDSVIVTDMQGKVIYYNQGAEAIFGYTADEMLGNTLLAIYPEVPDPETRKKTLDNLLSGISFVGEWQGKNKNGDKLWVDVKTSLLLDTKGSPIGLIGVSKNITDKKSAEKKLRQSEAYLQSVFDATIQSYFLIDNNYKIIKFNKTGANIISQVYNKQLQIGDNILDYTFPNDSEDFRKNVQKAFSGEKVLISREVVRPNNQRFWFEAQYLPALNENKEIYGVAFVALDITHRKQTEIALLKSYREVQNFRNALNSSALISITDTKGKILEVNDAFCTISKYSRDELTGKTHSVINSQYHTKDFFANMWRTIISGKSWRGEIKNKTKDGTYYWVDTSINPILDENGKIIQYLSVRNLITERKKAEEDREKLLKNLTKFAFMTAHNLRGPLARILGLVSILNLDNTTELMNKIAIEKLKVSAEELDAVIHKMIDMVNLNDLN